MLAAAARPGVVFGASRSGAYVFPRFLVAFDAVATLVSALGMLSGRRHRLSELVAAVPPTAVHRVTVAVPWEQTGAVMRTVLDGGHAGEVVLVDGIKVLHDQGWVLVVADPEVPAVNVTAEAMSFDIAVGRAEDYAGRVRRALGPAPPPSPAGLDSTMFSA